MNTTIKQATTTRAMKKTRVKGVAMNEEPTTKREITTGEEATIAIPHDTYINAMARLAIFVEQSGTGTAEQFAEFLAQKRHLPPLAIQRTMYGNGRRALYELLGRTDFCDDYDDPLMIEQTISARILERVWLREVNE